MKWTMILALFLCGCTCTISFRPISNPVSPVSVRRSTAKHTHAATKQRTVTVDSNWIDNYRQMEKEKNYVIPSDHNIQTDGGKFQVPRAVVDHYEDLVKTQPSATP